MPIKFTGPLSDGRWQRIWEKEFFRAMNEAVAHGEMAVARATPIGATGALRTGIVGKAKSAKLGIVRPSGPSTKYAAEVEFGRKPGRMPPFKPGSGLWLWVIRKLHASREEADSTAFLVARAIGKHGTKKKPDGSRGERMFKNVERNERRRFEQFFEAAKRRIEKRLSDK